MAALHESQPDLAYFKALVSAGMSGITSARREMDGGVFTPPLETALWGPTVAGAAIGALSTRLRSDRRASSLALGGLIGSVLGCAAALAWSSRRFTRHAARKAVDEVNAARDAHWLESHPIDYA